MYTNLIENIRRHWVSKLCNWKF